MRAVVLGAGADALVAARYLERSGASVVVLDPLPAPAGGDTAGAVPARLARELGLQGAGFRYSEPDPWLSAPLPSGGRLELYRDVSRSVEAIRRVSIRDAGRWPEFCLRMSRLSGILARLYSRPAPDPLTSRMGELLSLAATGAAVRRAGRQAVVDLLRVLPMSAAELLDDWFESDTLKGMLGAGGVMHLAQGPRSGGTAFQMLHHAVGSPAGVFRPPRSNLREVLRSAGGLDVRDGAGLRLITIRSGRATGVVLESGDEIPADVVLSSLDPRRTLLELSDPGWLDPEVARALAHVRCRGIATLAQVELERSPDFAALTLAPSLDYVERAWDGAKHGRVSDQPWLEATAAVRPGKAALEVLVQYTPFSPADGSWDESRRDSISRLVVRLLSEHAQLSDIRHVSVLTPPDLERDRHWPGGHAYHGELGLDQVLFMRPVPGMARYRTPVAGLYLCGPGTHPAGALAGVSGALAAREALRDRS